MSRHPSKLWVTEEKPVASLQIHTEAILDEMLVKDIKEIKDIDDLDDTVAALIEALAKAGTKLGPSHSIIRKLTELHDRASIDFQQELLQFKAGLQNPSTFDLSSRLEGVLNNMMKDDEITDIDDLFGMTSAMVAELKESDTALDPGSPIISNLALLYNKAPDDFKQPLMEMALHLLNPHRSDDKGEERRGPSL